MGLPSAHVGRRPGSRRWLFAFAITGGSWLLGWGLSWIIGGVLLLVVAGTWALERWLIAQDALPVAPALRLPLGRVVYRLDPPLWWMGSTVLGTAITIGAIAGELAAAAWLFGGLTIAAGAQVMRADITAQRIVVTDEALEMPVSPWSREVTVASLLDVQVRFDAETTTLWIKANGFDGCFRSRTLGRARVNQLAAVLEYRATLLRADRDIRA